MNSKQQGDIGVAMAIAYYTSSGFHVSAPMSDDTKYDLIVEKDQVICRVQCKTSGHQTSSGSYQVELRTSGGNQSWSKVVKTVNSSNCDKVFIYTLDGYGFEFNVEDIGSRTTIAVNPSHPNRVMKFQLGSEVTVG